MATFLFFLVLATGGAINNENAPTRVQSVSDVRVAVERSFHAAKPYDSGSLKKTDTGNFGND